VFRSPHFFLHTILLTVNQTGFKSIYSFVVVLLLKYVKNISQAKAHWSIYQSFRMQYPRKRPNHDSSVHVKDCRRGCQFTKIGLTEIKGKREIRLGLPNLSDSGIFDLVRKSGNVPLRLHYIAKHRTS
jgi:hypothetical protein